MMAHFGGRAFYVKMDILKMLNLEKAPHALLKGRKGPCIKTTNRKTFDSEAELSPGTPRLYN